MKKSISTLLAVLILFSTLAPAATAAENAVQATLYPAAQITQCRAQGKDSSYIATNDHILYLNGSLSSGSSANSSYIPSGYSPTAEPLCNAYTYSEYDSVNSFATFQMPPEDAMTGNYYLQVGNYTDLKNSPVEIVLSLENTIIRPGDCFIADKLEIRSVTQAGVDVTENYSVTDGIQNKTWYSAGKNTRAIAKIQGPMPAVGSTLCIQLYLRTIGDTTEAFLHGVAVEEYINICIRTIDKTMLYALCNYEKEAKRTVEEFDNAAQYTDYLSALDAAWEVYERADVGQIAINKAYETLRYLAPGLKSSLQFGENVWGWFDVPKRTLTMTGSGAVDFAGETPIQAQYIENIVLTEGIQEIRKLAIDGAKTTKISIPASLNSISSGALSDFASLQEVEVDPYNYFYASPDGILTDKQEKTILFFPAGYADTDVYPIPKTYTQIGEKAFAGTHTFTGVIAHNGITSIGADAFGADLAVQCMENTLTHKYCVQSGVRVETVPERTSVLTLDQCNGTVERTTYAFDYYGKVVEGEDGTKQVVGEYVTPVVDSVKSPSMKNYEFLGWFTQQEGGAEVTVKNLVLSEDRTLYAHWKNNNPSTYYIYYNANGGTGKPATQRKHWGVDICLSTQIPSKTITVTLDPCGGTLAQNSVSYVCTFLGWEASLADKRIYMPGEIYTENESIYLYAQWDTQRFGKLPTPKRDGYTFLGWYSKATNGQKIEADTTAYPNVTIYAYWIANDETYIQYNYTPNASDDTGDFPMIQSKPIGTDVQITDAIPQKHVSVWFSECGGTISEPEESLYKYAAEFIGWNTQPDGSGEMYLPGQTCSVDEPLMLYPLWRYPTLDAIPTPVRENYTFLGWFEEETDVPITPGRTVDRNLYYYAQWEQYDGYVVLYNANGGLNQPEKQTKSATEDLVLSEKVPTAPITQVRYKPGIYGTLEQDVIEYIPQFLEWNTQPDGTGQSYHPGDVYTENENMTLYAIWEKMYFELPVPQVLEMYKQYTFDYWYEEYYQAETDEDVQIRIEPNTQVRCVYALYAHWSKSETYTIAFNANGGTGAPAEQKIKSGETNPLSAQQPQRSFVVQFNPNGGSLTSRSLTFDCRFIGWNTMQNGDGIAYKGGDGITPTGNMTLYAQWGYPQIVLPEPVLDGYTFVGWYTERTGGTKVEKTDLVEADRTLYAHWSQVPTYAVTYHGNGGTGNVADVQIKTEDEPLILTETVPARTHTVRYDPCGGALSVKSQEYDLRFTGWNTEKNGGGIQYRGGQTYSANAPLTLYAQWEIPTLEMLPTPVYVGRYFDGWYTQKDGGTEVTQDAQITKDMTLYAHWKDLSYSFNNWSPSISAATYRAAFGSSTMTDRLSAVIASMVYPNSGICYGMATTAMLMIPGGRVQTDSFGESAIWDFSFRKIGDYTNGAMTLENFIKQMQVSQYSASAQNSIKRDTDALIRTVQDGNIVRISITKNKQGHALVGYKLTKVSDDRLRLFVYDCNHSGDYTRYITLQKTGSTWRWSYDMGNGLGTWSSETGVIGYQTYADVEAIWNNMGRLIYATGGKQEHLMIVQAERFALYDGEGKYIATYDGGFTQNALNLQEITVECTELSEQANTWHLFYLPADTVTVRNLSGGSFHAELIDLNYGAIADTTADTVLFTVRDVCEAAGADGSVGGKVCRTKISDSMDKSYTYAVQMFPGQEENGDCVSGKSDKPMEFSLENGKVFAGFIENLSLRSSTYTLRYGESTVLYVETDNLPDGTKVIWTCEDKTVRLEPASDGMSCRVVSVGNGNAQICATIVDKNGTVRKRADGQDAVATLNMKSKVNLFWVVVSFFKNLFRISREQ
ncbi:MAG: InlB B-repeat-containing protein [Oscillospiraceae bacterium]|nr:InlB B-repeat-containing protein [Oscillospiraceae bacterium]